MYVTVLCLLLVGVLPVSAGFPHVTPTPPEGFDAWASDYVDVVRSHIPETGTILRERVRVFCDLESVPDNIPAVWGVYTKIWYVTWLSGDTVAVFGDPVFYDPDNPSGGKWRPHD